MQRMPSVPWTVELGPRMESAAFKTAELPRLHRGARHSRFCFCFPYGMRFAHEDADDGGHDGHHH